MFVNQKHLLLVVSHNFLSKYPVETIPGSVRPLALSDTISNEHLIKTWSRDHIYYEIKKDRFVPP